eukprot:scaffold47613_cov66-Phaeocystis_antarctica.AAC.2
MISRQVPCFVAAYPRGKLWHPPCCPDATLTPRGSECPGVRDRGVSSQFCATMLCPRPPFEFASCRHGLALAGVCHGKGRLPVLVIKAEERRARRPRISRHKSTVRVARLVGHTGVASTALACLLVLDEEDGLDRIGQRRIDRSAVDDDFVVARMELGVAVVDTSVLGMELE